MAAGEQTDKKARYHGFLADEYLANLVDQISTEHFAIRG